QMREQPFYAVLSGFVPDQVPGVGTFNDFLNRLTAGPPRPVRRPRRRLTPQRKAELREAKKRLGPRHVKLVRRIANALRRGGRHFAPSPTEQLVNQLLTDLCVKPAVEQGLLPEGVGVSGDGTKIATWANSYGKKVCNCP